MDVFVCPACARRFRYEVPTCTFCRVDLERQVSDRATVLAVTQVTIPMTGHEEVPYWCALVETEDGTRAVLKSPRPVRIGDEVRTDTLPDVFHTIGVIGTGVMGKGLVELLLSQGHDVVWVGRSESSLERAMSKLSDRLARSMDDAEIGDAVRRLHATSSMDALGSCDIVIEAVIEEFAEKAEVLREADKLLAPDALLATNTSGLSIAALGALLEHPERFGALHFFNPATRMRLVELALSPSTSDKAEAELREFASSLGKVTVQVADRPAFVVNRVLMPLINEAVRALEEGAASAADIDEAVRLGLNHPMGPLALADLIGLDIVLHIMDNLVAQTGDDGYQPRPLLRRLVEQGKLGRKTRAGFHDYE